MSSLPPSKDLNLSTTSKVLLNSAVSSGSRNAGFANLINLKDECTVTRGRRHIQISQLGITSTATNTVSTEGPAPKKRWSFHSSNQINDILKEDKAMKPIISPKRRKSSGTALTKGTSETCTFTEEVSQKSHSRTSLREQSQTSRHVLTSRQLESFRNHHHRRSKLITLRKSETSSSRDARVYDIETYFTKVDPYPSSYHQFRMRKSKPCRETTAPDHLSSLPDEVLLRIFKYLPKPSLANLARTSHRYSRLIEDETLWKRLCVMGRIMEPEHLLIILSRKPVYLRMSRAYIPDPVEVPSDLSSLASSSQISHLDLSAAEINSSVLALIMKISPKLVKLSLEHLVVTKEVLEAMTPLVATIEVLNLTMCYDLDAIALSKFFSSCERLRELNMGCLRVDWGIEALTNVCNSLPATVQQLNISGFRNLLDNTHVEIIATRCPRLIELDLSDSQEVKSIEYILKLVHLQHLCLSRCYGIEPPVYTLLADHRSLKYIDLFSLFKENSIRQLSSNLPRLEINKFPFSAIARPTVGNKRSSIWLQRVRD